MTALVSWPIKRCRWLLCCVGAIILGGAQHASASEVVVHAAGYYQSGGTCGGATNPVHIQSDPNPQGGIQVGFFEASAGAIGEMSKASGWLAALVSTDLLGEDLSKHRISFSRTDRVDGPSAGGLMTSGLVALLRDEPFPADVSMTGTINPDGTIGPVGGIAHKIMGASNSGIKRFAIPLGQRHDYNLCTEEVEDVVEIGRALGVEVAEVGDVREAYAFLTGVDLPSAPVRPISEQLPEDVRAGYRALYDTWLKRYKAAQDAVAGAPQRDFPKELRSIWRHGELFLESSERELNTGHEPAAFNRIWMAVLHAEYTARGVAAMQALHAGGFPGLQAVVGNDLHLVQREVESGLAQLRDISITTVADTGAVATIGSLVAITLAYLDQAATELALSKELSLDRTALDPEEIVLLAFDAISHMTFAELLMDAALLNKNWIGQGAKLWQKAPERVLSARSLYTSAARSNLRYVDVLYTEREADKRKQDLQSATQRVKRKDLAYLAAVGALEKQYDFFNIFDDDYTAAVAQLGALMGTLANASVLVAQHYSIGVETDKLGRVIGLYSEAALEHMMAMAEATALRAAGEADAATAGDSTPMLVVALDAARRNRDAAITAQDKLTALSMFWTTTLNARLMTKLAGAQ